MKKIVRLKLVCLCFGLLGVGTAQLWSQVEPSATGGGVITPADDMRMATPPPISGDYYPMEVGPESRSNYVSAGVAFTAAYTDNLMNVQANNQVGDETYTIVPNFSLERKTPRAFQSLNYGSGFTFYQHTSDLNAITQNATAEYQYHFSRYSSLTIQDYFNQNFNSYNQSSAATGNSVPGLPQVSSTVLVAPFEEQISNVVTGQVAYQFARDAMIGGGGDYAFLNFGNLANVPGLNESHITGASAFYSRRLTRSQYMGVTYLYSKISTHPQVTTTTTNAILGFYTIYLSEGFSVSVSGGPQHFTAVEPPFPDTSGWSPAISGTLGWRSRRASAAASYSRIISGGQGLTGAYHSDLASGSARWLMSRTWSGGVEMSYSNYTSATSNSAAYAGGNTLIGTVSIHHSMGERLSGELGYSHFHQLYSQIEAVSKFPDSNRVYLSISYQLRRPLGR